jgi:hypothetical protein
VCKSSPMQHFELTLICLIRRPVTLNDVLVAVTILPTMCIDC